MQVGDSSTVGTLVVVCHNNGGQTRYPNNMFGSIASWLAFVLSVCFLLSFAEYARAASVNAEIVLLIGVGESREETSANWRPAAVKQQLKGGSFVRTLANSQVGILMSDRTQIRLNQNSQLQIKTGAESTQWTENVVRLNAGRAWSQARPQTVPWDFSVKPGKVVMETPSATLSIRGTDWDVEVSPDGTTRLAVLTGVVVMSNDLGAVNVAPGESALAEEGKAPVKLILMNPASRVQWVSSWKPQPRRWLGGNSLEYLDVIRQIESGDYSAALNVLKPALPQDPLAALLTADLLIFQGDAAASIAVLSSHTSSESSDPRLVAMLARALIREDRLSEAQTLLESVSSKSSGSIDVLLAAGELAIIQGDAGKAKVAFGHARILQPDNADAWYGLGLIESERENTVEARTLLSQALQSDPKLSRAAAELAAVETFAGNLVKSDALLGEVLRHDSANYVALTARGINLLKGARPLEALEDFLRAGLIEPRYARAWLFSGVAFYQLGERDRAEQAFLRAAALDDRDPVPYLFTSLVQADSLDFGASIAAARNAQERMPYLKSLNQIANNQRGNANLGSSLSNLGAEEWAKYYADAAYTPFWAGSHLFLSDRYTGKFNKNSELFQGFLSDPIVFGSSNRSSSLVAGPGHYGRFDAMFEHNDWQQNIMIGTVNGLVIEPAPMAYYISGDLSNASARDDPSSAKGSNLTVGLGAKPRFDTGVFGFATDTRISARLHTPNLTDNPLDQSDSRRDIGFNYRAAPDSQFWWKAGYGQQSNAVSGPYVSQATADSLNSALKTIVFMRDGLLDGFQSGLDQEDMQFRHSFAHGSLQWSWGFEHSSESRTDHVVSIFTPARISIDQVLSVRAENAYLSARHDSGSFASQFDIFSEHFQVRRTGLSALDLLTSNSRFVLDDSDLEQTYSELNPRLGIQWRPSAYQTMRVVGQQWRRPASISQLAQVDTLGIAANDRLVAAGGLYKRVRVQFDTEPGTAGFFQVFVDREAVDNGLSGQRSAISDFGVTQLESLRNRPEVFTAPSDIEETPIFSEGNVSTFGLAASVLLSNHQTITARYLRRDASQSGVNAGLLIPYLPRDFLQLGSRWSMPNRWLLGVRAVYRSGRYRDDSNRAVLQGGWDFGLTAFWETTDKRSSVQAIVDNLLSSSNVGINPSPHVMVRYSYRH